MRKEYIGKTITTVSLLPESIKEKSDVCEIEIGDVYKTYTFAIISYCSSNFDLFPSLDAELSNDSHEHFLFFKQVCDLLVGSEVVVCLLLQLVFELGLP